MSVAAVLTAGVLSSPTAFAIEMFLKVGDIQGESRNPAHVNEIDVLSWSWGLTASSRMKTAAACVDDLDLVKYIDSASPGLMIALTVGQNLGEATLTIRKDGKNNQELLIIKMQDVGVSNVTSGASADEGIPTEHVSLSFSYADWTYYKQNLDGSLGEPTTARIYSGEHGCG